jgi:multisubunit Na+/H+ antiporter MnhB subunit
MRSMREIQRADPAARRISLLTVGCVAVAGLVLIALAGSVRPELQSWLQREPRARLRLVMVVLVSMTSAPLLGFAVYFWRLGQRIRRADRYPPPGYRVTRDTPVVTGHAAQGRGQLVQFLAAVLAAAALILTALLWRLVSLVSV